MVIYPYDLLISNLALTRKYIFREGMFRAELIFILSAMTMKNISATVDIIIEHNIALLMQCLERFECALSRHFLSNAMIIRFFGRNDIVAYPTFNVSI
jgi:hypothetical protein